MNDIDNNGNYYPSIYTRNTTNSSTHIEQVIEALEDTGFLRVSFSAYLDTPLLDISRYNPWKYTLENHIRPLMNLRAILPVDSAATSPNHELVFVYDIEEITAISDRHFRELRIMLPSIESLEFYLIVEYVLYVLNIHESSDLLSHIVGNIEDVFNAQTEDLKNIAPNYEALKNMYNEVSQNFDRKKSIISEDLLERCEVTDENEKRMICEIAEELQKIYHQRWKTVDKCLKLVNRKSQNSIKKYANVVLSKLGVAYGMSQLLMSGHGSLIPPQNVYSTENLSKEAVFERIQRRFGRNCTLVYITSFPQRASIPAKLNIPIWHVTSNDSIRKLYKAQRELTLPRGLSKKTCVIQ